MLIIIFLLLTINYNLFWLYCPAMHEEGHLYVSLEFKPFHKYVAVPLRSARDEDNHGLKMILMWTGSEASNQIYEIVVIVRIYTLPTTS